MRLEFVRELKDAIVHHDYDVACGQMVDGFELDRLEAHDFPLGAGFIDSVPGDAEGQST